MAEEVGSRKIISGSPEIFTDSPSMTATLVSACPCAKAETTTQRKMALKKEKREFCVATGSPRSRFRNLLTLCLSASVIGSSFMRRRASPASTHESPCACGVLGHAPYVERSVGRWRLAADWAWMRGRAHSCSFWM